MRGSRFTLAALLIGVTGLVSSSSVGAQSLAEVAAQSKARRDKEREARGTKRPRVFTEEDLQKGATPGEEGKPPPPDPALAAQTPRVDSRSDEEKDAADAPAAGGTEEAQWKARARQARAPVATAEGRLKQAEADVERFRQDLNPMSTTFSQDPYVILRLQGELTQAEAKAAEALKQVEDARKEYEAFQAEALRSGAAPGWLSE